MENNQLSEVMTGFARIYLPTDIVVNLLVAAILGLFISVVYKNTHRGLSYSQSFMVTIILVTVIVSMVMMVIGNNIARAFALVGALSIIRFRTVVKDTKDTAFVFMALAAGMAAGTSSYFLAIVGTGVISTVAFLLHLSNYGTLHSTEFILRLRLFDAVNPDQHLPILANHCKKSTLLHLERAGDQESVKLTFDVVLKKDKTPLELSSALNQEEGISEVVIVASEQDVDY
ncbi:MAG: DUF4956 domain-containing protein [Candidatus Puniceispirillaceae bacterium]